MADFQMAESPNGLFLKDSLRNPETRRARIRDPSEIHIQGFTDRGEGEGVRRSAVNLPPLPLCHAKLVNRQKPTPYSPPTFKNTPAKPSTESPNHRAPALAARPPRRVAGAAFLSASVHDTLSEASVGRGAGKQAREQPNTHRQRLIKPLSHLTTNECVGGRSLRVRARTATTGLETKKNMNYSKLF